MQMQLPSPVQHTLSVLNTAGFEAYAVGGCVRDTMLGKQPMDWDITTSAQPEQVLSVFADYRTIPTGIQHGTVTVIVEDMPQEITTYRIDGMYTDSRHPNEVFFTTSLQEDLRRRDFTVNAMAYHPEYGLVDCFSGAADLAAGKIACVGDPERRFTEDALRILRALRFASVLGFSIEKVTADTIHKLAPLLRRVSAERIADELKKLLVGDYVRNVLIDFADVFCIILPELQPLIGLRQDNPYHHLTVYEHTVETVAAVKNDLPLRLTMLFHDVGKPACYTRDEQGVDHFRGHPAISAAIAERAMERLHLDNATIGAVKNLIMHHDDSLSLQDKRLKRLLNRLDSAAYQLVEVQRADVYGQHPAKRDRLAFLDAVEVRLTELEKANACFRLRDLAVNGDDLLAIGYSSGRQLGDALYKLLDAVMDDVCPNERASLLKLAKEWL